MYELFFFTPNAVDDTATFLILSIFFRIRQNSQLMMVEKICAVRHNLPPEGAVLRDAAH